MSNVSKRVTKISAIKYFAIMGMVCLHTTFILEENSIPEVLISSIAGIGLPLFFWLSGYFYFNKYKVSRNTQIISKVKRILVPYLIWQIVAILMIVSIQMMGFSCPHSIPSSLLQILESIVLGKNNAPLWYLRVVFVLFMLSPALIELMEIEEKIAGGGYNSASDTECIIIP